MSPRRDLKIIDITPSGDAVSNSKPSISALRESRLNWLVICTVALLCFLFSWAQQSLWAASFTFIAFAMSLRKNLAIRQELNTALELAEQRADFEIIDPDKGESP